MNETDISSDSSPKDLVFVAKSEFDSNTLTAMFSTDFLNAFKALLEKKCVNGVCLPRTEAAYSLGLTPALKILDKKEDESLRDRCTIDFKTACISLGITLGEKDKIEGNLTEDQKSKLLILQEEKAFDAYDIYKAKRANNLEKENILGIIVNEGVVPGYLLQKGPGGGIAAATKSDDSSSEKVVRTSVKTPKFPEGFIETAIAALNALLPSRKYIASPKPFAKRSTITGRMAGLWHATHNGEIKWLGSEFETMLSAALTSGIITGFKSERGAGKGFYRLSVEELSKETPVVTEPVSEKVVADTSIENVLPVVLDSIVQEPAIEVMVDDGSLDLSLKEDTNDLSAEISSITDPEFIEVEKEERPARPRSVDHKNKKQKNSARAA